MIRTTLIALAACTVAGWAAAEDYSTLLSNSPFAPVGPGAAAGGDKSVEFRGMFTEQNNTYFSILDTATQKSAWVGMNETGHPFVVRSYNASNDTVTVELGGHNVNLALKHAAVQLAAATPKPAAPAPNGGPEGGPQRNGRWMQNVMGADGRPDPKRMEAFIEEMRRRRAQRMQSFANGTPGEGGGGAMPNAPGAGSGPMPMPGAAPNGQTGNIPMPSPSAGPGAVPVDLNNPNR
jgi:hypothetical protein